MDENDTTYSLESVVESDIAPPPLEHSMPFKDCQHWAPSLLNADGVAAARGKTVEQRIP